MKYEQYPSRSAKRNYFPLPNEIFSLGLTTGEIATYAYLMKCEDRQTYQCYPSYGDIGEAIGRKENTVAKYVRGLEEKHLIYTEPTTGWGKGGLKRNGNLRFTIRPIEEAKRYRRIANNYIKPHLGDKKIGSVTTADVQKMYNWLRENGRINEHYERGNALSDSSVRGIHMMLHQAMDAAVQERIIVKNPTDGTVIPKANYAPKKHPNGSPTPKVSGCSAAG